MNKKNGHRLYDNYIITSFDVAYALSKALDLVNPLINNHHQRVAFIAGSIAKEAGKSTKEIENIIIASLLHDIGVVVEKEFHELADPDDNYENEFCHVIVGSYLLDGLNIFPNISQLVKYHHSPYSAKTNPLSDTDEIPELAYIIHLADRIDILINRDKPALEQKSNILDKISKSATNKFHPDHYQAFLRLADKEHFWFDIEEQDKYQLVKFNFSFSHLNMTLDDVLETAKLLSRIIDFRCVFTSTHSAGVAAVAYKIAELMGLSADECKSAMISGYLHDIGKLAISSEILYKDGKLTDDEIQIMKKHPYYTYTILNSFQIFETIKDWASFHHEHLDGTGYPFHLSEEKLCLGSRILAIADIFTALSEERPYRQPKSKSSLIDFFNNEAKNNKLDSRVISTLNAHFDEINSARSKMQQEAATDFNNFQKNIFDNKICIQNKNFISVLNTK